MTLKKKSSEIYARMDFIHTMKCITEKDGSISYMRVITPDPHKYEQISYNNQDALKDKFTGIIYTLDDIKAALDRIPENSFLPINNNFPKIKSPCEYLKEKESEILKGLESRPELVNGDISIEKILKRFVGCEAEFAIMFVDMEGSTKMSYDLDSETNEKIVKIFLTQVAQIIDVYQGYVLKFSGDCVIGIFPTEINAPNTCDNVIQAAITIRNLLEDVINPIFFSAKLPEIGYHIGIDIGTVKITNFQVPNIANFTDLIGYSINLTSKIQKIADHNEILIGRQLFSEVHCSWQKDCVKKELNESWTIKDPFFNEKIYELYSLKTRWNCS